MSERIGVHLYPIWGDEANYLIFAEFSIFDHKEIKQEQLWCRQLSEYTFKICCIPFFVYDISLGDIVETDSIHIITRIIEKSGHFTFRVWFGDSEDIAFRLELTDRITQLGGLVEWSSKNLLAIDAPTEELANSFSDYLFQKEQMGKLIYESGDPSKGRRIENSGH
jgi:hypothetical protein